MDQPRDQTLRHRLYGCASRDRAAAEPPASDPPECEPETGRLGCRFLLRPRRQRARGPRRARRIGLPLAESVRTTRNSSTAFIGAGRKRSLGSGCRCEIHPNTTLIQGRGESMNISATHFDDGMEFSFESRRRPAQTSASGTKTAARRDSKHRKRRSPQQFNGIHRRRKKKIRW